MRDKRYILSFLFFTSIIILVVPVVPYYHRTNGVIRMKNDMTSEPQCPRHHRHPGNDLCYNDGCMTRPNSLTPSIQADSNPYYLFTAISSTGPIIESLSKPQERRIKSYYAYRKSLHDTVINCVFDLCAPSYPVI